MAIGSEIKSGWAGQTRANPSGTLNLGTVIDPLDLFSGRGAKQEMQAAQQAQLAAQQEAVASQERMFERGLEYMAPYREYGQRALPQLTGSLQPGSQLGTMRSQLGQQYMPQALGATGFDQSVIDELMGKYQSAIAPQEETARMNRARDVMNLGMGAGVQASGMAGQQGRSLSDIYLQGAQQQGQLSVDKALARRQQGMGVAYGGYRTLQNYLGGAYG